MCSWRESTQLTGISSKADVRTPANCIFDKFVKVMGEQTMGNRRKVPQCFGVRSRLSLGYFRPPVKQKICGHTDETGTLLEVANRPPLFRSFSVPNRWHNTNAFSLWRTFRPCPEAEIPNVAGKWLADLLLLFTPVKRRADCVQPHFCATSAQAILKNLGWRFCTMAKLVYGMNQSLDGYVDHLEFRPSPRSFVTS